MSRRRAPQTVLELEQVRPPADIDTERVVLGSCLVPQLRDEVWGDDRLREGLFSTENHRAIFLAARAIAARGEVADLVSVGAALRVADVDMDEDELASLWAATLDIGADFRAAVGRLVAYEQRRAALFVARRMVQAALDDGSNLPVVMASALDEGTALLANDVSDADESLATTIGFEIPRVLGLPPDTIDGLATGFDVMDRWLRGLSRVGLHIIAGRPGMGKSAFAQQIAEYVAETQGFVAYFSFEMSKEELAMRSITQRTGIPLLNIATNDLTDDQRDQVRYEAARIRGLDRLLVIDRIMSVAEMGMHVRRLKLRYGRELVAVEADYLGLFGDRLLEGENTVAKIERQTQEMKQQARSTEIPMICLAQLNRKGATGRVRPPSLTDLRGSGSIEQDADTVIFLHRPSYYETNPPPSGEASIIIAKQRRGRVGAIPVYWNGPGMAFRRLDSSAGGDVDDFMPETVVDGDAFPV